MREPTSTADRRREEDARGETVIGSRFDARAWPAMKRPMLEVKPLPMLPRPVPVAVPTLRVAQNACYEAFSLALKEGQVFAALTGPPGCGKTTVLEAVLADRRDRALRCIRITDPDKVPPILAEQIEQVAYAEATRSENLERHVVLAVDDAHLASPALLQCLSRLAAMREPGRRVPQIIMVGRPELWNVLGEEQYEPLARRLAIRAALPAAEEDSDPWAAVESDLAQTMTQLRGEQLPVVQEHQPGPSFAPDNPFETYADFAHESADADPHGARPLDEDDIPPPSLFALFPDPPPAVRPGRQRRRLLMPLVSLFVGLVIFAFALSFYDWPDLLGDMPWSEAKPSAPFVMPRSPQAQSYGLPQPPSSFTPESSTPRTTEAKPSRMAAVPAKAPVSPPAVKIPPVAVRETPLPLAQPETKAATPPPVPAAVPTPAPIPVPTPIETAPRLVPAGTASVQATPPPATISQPVVTPPASGPAAVVASVAAPAKVTAAPVLSPAVIALLLRRGDEQSAIGDISAARLLYERAAEAGSGLAARQMARTYDPPFLPSAVEATLADPAKARQWYERAASLGNSDAATRLKALGQGR